MTALRRRLRWCAAVWLAFQVVALSAFAPRDCCAAHEAAHADAEPDCHERAATPASHCPMPAADGTPCPMHRGQPGAATETDADCTMNGTCGPTTAMAILLWQHGVLNEPIDGRLAPGTSALVAAPQPHLESRPGSPDAPPPRR